MECFPANCSEIREIVDFVANASPHLMQQKGSSSLRVIGCIASGIKFICGSRERAFSGHVLTQRPHCTQALSMNRSLGSPGVSITASAGQADTHDMHRVHASTLISMRPYGAPSGILRTFAVLFVAVFNAENVERAISLLEPDGIKDWAGSFLNLGSSLRNS